jgi:hypothetical protein
MRLNTPSGSINQFLSTNKKTGIQYPKINGHRDPNNPAHWRWNYTYKLPTPTGFVTKSISVDRSLIGMVQKAISSGDSISSILALLGKSQ